MITYGTLKSSGAFRMLCRAYGLEMEDYNEFAKSIDSSDEDELINHPEFGDIYKDSKNYIGLIESSSIHPCAYLLLDEPIDEEVGLTRSGDNVVCNITSKQADVWKFLKDDFLEVDDTRIVDKVSKKINKEIPTVNELLEDLIDDSVFKLYEDGITSTLNQVNTETSTNLVKKYKPQNYAELGAFVAAIRPNFQSLLDTFLNRKEYSTGVDALDKILEKTDHFLLYQENVMAFLNWLGIPLDECYSIIKKIAKKDKSLTGYLNELEDDLKDVWLDKGHSEDDFYRAWQIVMDSVGYGFNASHAISTALMSLYQAYYKRYYPLVYYSVVLDMYESDLDKTNRLVDELDYFNIKLKSSKYGYSKGEYTPDPENDTIYKGLGSIKYLNSEVGDRLYELSQEYNPETFIELLQLIDEHTGLRSNQLEILIWLDYFKEFGNSKKLKILADFYNNLADRSQLHKDNNIDTIDDLISYGVKLSEIKELSDETNKLYRNIDFIRVLEKLEKNIDVRDYTIPEKIEFQREYLGYINLVMDDVDGSVSLVLSIDTKYSPKIKLYSLGTGVEFMAKIDKKMYSDFPVNQGDVIHITNMKQKYGWKYVDGDYKKNYNKLEWWLEGYDIVNNIDEVKQ